MLRRRRSEFVKWGSGARWCILRQKLVRVDKIALGACTGILLESLFAVALEVPHIAEFETARSRFCVKQDTLRSRKPLSTAKLSISTL